MSDSTIKHPESLFPEVSSKNGMCVIIEGLHGFFVLFFDNENGKTTTSNEYLSLLKIAKNASGTDDDGTRYNEAKRALRESGLLLLSSDYSGFDYNEILTIKENGDRFVVLNGELWRVDSVLSSKMKVPATGIGR